MRRTILIVDDDTGLLELLSEAFTDAGFSVVTAVNGADAIKAARSHLPDLIVLDLILPETDGFTVCEVLRRDRATAGIPVVMLTGLTGELSRIAGLGCGANDYLTKPVSPGALIARVELHLGKLSHSCRRIPDQSCAPAQLRPDRHHLPSTPTRAVADAC